MRFKRFPQHVARLRQRAFTRVHQQHHAIHHFERALHLSAEVGVPRRIHNVDLDVVIKNGRVLGQNRDPALAFQLVRVHDAFCHGLIGAESAALAEHGVHQRRFAVVHMSDDGDVANTQTQKGSFLNYGLLPLYYVGNEMRSCWPEVRKLLMNRPVSK